MIDRSLARRARASSRAAQGVALWLCLGAIGACDTTSDETRNENTPPPMAVETSKARRALVAPPVQAIGSVADGEQRELAFETGGRVAEVLVREGDRVRRGQVLARLDTGSLDAQIAEAEARLSNVEHQAARARALRASTIAAAPRYGDAMQAVVAGRASLRQAREVRAHAKLVAPADGVVLRRILDPGEVTGPGVPLLVVSSAVDSKVVKLGVTDRDVVRITPGDRALVRIDALPELRLEGSVAAIAQVPAPTTGTYEVTVALPADAPIPRSGLVARTTIEPSAKRPTVLVPIEALVDAEGDRGALFVLGKDGAHVSRKPVRPGFLLGDEVGIVEGLEGGEEVVVCGVDRLADGVAVRAHGRSERAR